jgi:hypothetical protein
VYTTDGELACHRWCMLIKSALLTDKYESAIPVHVLNSGIFNDKSYRISDHITDEMWTWPDIPTHADY